MSGDQLSQLKQLERENEQLRRVVASLILYKQILAGVAGRPVSTAILTVGALGPSAGRRKPVIPGVAMPLRGYPHSWP